MMFLGDGVSFHESYSCSILVNSHLHSQQGGWCWWVYLFIFITGAEWFLFESFLRQYCMSEPSQTADFRVVTMMQTEMLFATLDFLKSDPITAAYKVLGIGLHSRELAARCAAPDLLPSVLSFPGNRKQRIFTLMMQIPSMQFAAQFFFLFCTISLHSLHSWRSLGCSVSVPSFSWNTVKQSRLKWENAASVIFLPPPSSPTLFPKIDMLCFWFKRLHWTFSWPDISCHTLNSPRSGTAPVGRMERVPWQPAVPNGLCSSALRSTVGKELT